MTTGAVGAAEASQSFGWNLIPPERCLKHRHGGRAGALAVQVQPIARGRNRPAQSVAYGDVGGDVVIGDLDTLDACAGAEPFVRELLSAGLLEHAS